MKGMVISMKQKKRIFRRRFVLPAFYFLLDGWFRRMSRRGWVLVDYKKYKFTFERGMPKEREFFTYHVSRTDKRDNRLPLRYPDLRRQFGTPKQYSKLNAGLHNDDGVAVLEIHEKNLGREEYRKLRRDRNLMYFLRLLADIGLLAIMFGIFYICWLLTRD